MRQIIKLMNLFTFEDKWIYQIKCLQLSDIYQTIQTSCQLRMRIVAAAERDAVIINKWMVTKWIVTITKFEGNSNCFI